MKYLLVLLAASAAKRTIRNPNTGRMIQVGGKTFSEVIKSGGYIVHNSKFHAINFNNDGMTYKDVDGDSPDDGYEDYYELQPNICNDKTDGLLFVHKPAHLLSKPGIGPEKTDSLVTRVCVRYPTAKLCHRLDRDTSGVMVLGLTADAHRAISKLFELRLTKKVYVCLVDGHVQNDSGIIDLPIGKKKSLEGFNRWVIGGEKSRDAKTEYRVDQRLETAQGHPYSRVIVRPLTGRGHQIRLHMKALGHPLLGDALHSPPKVAFATPRLCLHARSLSLQFDSELCHVEVPSPF